MYEYTVYACCFLTKAFPFGAEVDLVHKFTMAHNQAVVHISCIYEYYPNMKQKFALEPHTHINAHTHTHASSYK